MSAVRTDAPESQMILCEEQKSKQRITAIVSSLYSLASWPDSSFEMNFLGKEDAIPNASVVPSLCCSIYTENTTVC